MNRSYLAKYDDEKSLNNDKNKNEFIIIIDSNHASLLIQHQIEGHIDTKEMD